MAAFTLTTAPSCGGDDESDKSDTTDASGMNAMGGMGGTATGGTGGTTMGGAGGTAAGGRGGSGTGGAGGAGGIGGATGATGGMGGAGGRGGTVGTGAPMSCKFAPMDNPNKAEVSYMITDASPDANLTRPTYAGETRSTVTYNPNPILRMLGFAFSYPFVGVGPAPCVSFVASVGGVEQPAVGKSITVPVNATSTVVDMRESPTCAGSRLTWKGWALAGPGTVTFTKVDGGKIEFDFSFPMGGKLSNGAAGSYTLKGSIKSPCYFIE